MADFIYIKEDYNSNSITIKQNEVGIIVSGKDNDFEIQFVNYKDTVIIPKSLIEVFDPTQTGDQYSHKICNRCNRLLPTNTFQKNQNGKNNRPVRRPSCNSCRKQIDGKSILASKKTIWNKTKPNMSIWECPICKKRTIPGLTSKIVLDHNHQTGEPNAWICDSCNTGLGRFKDDIKVMEEAIEYLKKYQN